MHAPQVLHLGRRARRLVAAAVPQRLGALHPARQLALEKRLGAFDFPHVVAALRQGVAVAGRLEGFFVFAREFGRQVGEDFRAAGDVGGQDGEGVGRGLQGARAAVEGVDVGSVPAQGVGEVAEGGLQRGGRLLDVRPEFLRVVADGEGSFGFFFQIAGHAAFFGAHGFEALDDFLLTFFELEEALLEVFVASAFFFDLGFEGFAGAARGVEVGLHVLIFGVEGLDAGFGAFGFVEVFVDDGGLGFAETDEVDDVGEDFDEALVGGFEEVGEGEVVDATLMYQYKLASTARGWSRDG